MAVVFGFGEDWVQSVCITLFPCCTRKAPWEFLRWSGSDQGSQRENSRSWNGWKWLWCKQAAWISVISCVQCAWMCWTWHRTHPTVKAPAETGQPAHSLTKNSFCLQWYAVPFLYRCFPLQRATFSYLLADVLPFFFFLIFPSQYGVHEDARTRWCATSSCITVS